MSSLLTSPNQIITEPDLPGNDPTPSPLASPAEAASSLFASDAGGVEYLFGGGILAAVATPLEDVPHNSPDAGAIAMASVNEGAAGDNAHVSGMPDIPTPVTGGEIGLSSGEATGPDAPAPSLLRQTMATEGARLKAVLARLGGQVGGASG